MGVSVVGLGASAKEFNPREKLTLLVRYTTSDPTTTVEWTSSELSLVYGETTSTQVTSNYLVVLPESPLDGSLVFEGGKSCES